MQENKFIIFSLTKRGCIHYAQTVCDLLSKHIHTLYISKFSDPGFPAEASPIHTYRTLGEALILTPVFFFKSLGILWRVRNQNLMIYLPSFHPWNLILCLWCKLFKIQCILTIHELRRHTGEENKLIDLIQSISANLATKLVFLSNFERDKTSDKLSWWDKSKVIPHPLIGANFIKENTKTFSPEPSLLFLGRKYQYKGINLLSKAVAELPENAFREITLAGSGPISGFSPDFNSRLRILDKYLTNEELSDLLAQHDILILPYSEASQSGILAMGIQAVIPMIITEVGGLPEQVPGEAVLFVSPDPNAIKNAVLAISSDQSLFDRIKTKLKLAKTNQLVRDSSFASELINWK
jgi:glycosyltransferase involved in cell wall biosynthesis